MEVQSLNSIVKKETLAGSKVKSKAAKLISISNDEDEDSESLRKIIQAANLMIIEKNFEQGFESLYTNLKAMQQKEKDSKWDVESQEVMLKGYYLLGFCCIKLGKIKKAKDILISAYWKSLKIKEKNKDDAESALEDDLTIIRLKAFASLFESEKKLDKTVNEYCQCLYSLASRYGPAHIKCLSLYYSIGCVFLKLHNRRVEAARFLTKFVNIWADIVLLALLDNTVHLVLDQFLEHFQLDFKENLINLQELFDDYNEFVRLKVGRLSAADQDTLQGHWRVYNQLGGAYFQSKLALVLMVLNWKTGNFGRMLKYKKAFAYARGLLSESEWSALLCDIDLSHFKDK